MAKLSSKTSAILLMVAFAMISSLPREAESARLTISWPKWNWCFPECVLGDTCFLKVHRYCTHQMPNTSLLNCIVVALEWCDLEHFSINDLVLPPGAYSSNGDGDIAPN